MQAGSSRSVVAAALFTMALASAGCARTARFSVLRPALLDASPVGNTMSVGEIAPNGHAAAAAEVSADLARRIAGSLNPSVRLLASGGGVVITGGVLADDYREDTETVSQTCSRTVDDGTDANGMPQSHTESYDCSYTVTIGVGTSQLVFEIRNGAGGQPIFRQSYERTETGGTGNEARESLLHAARAGIVETFSHVILPWREVVEVRFKSCDGSPACKQGFERARAGDLAAAEALFTAALGDHADTALPVPPKQAELVGEALYNRAIIRSYLGRDDEARADLRRAIVLLPERKSVPKKLAEVEMLARDHEALRRQGVLPGPPK